MQTNTFINSITGFKPFYFTKLEVNKISVYRFKCQKCRCGSVVKKSSRIFEGIFECEECKAKYSAESESFYLAGSKKYASLKMSI